MPIGAKHTPQYTLKVLESRISMASGRKTHSKVSGRINLFHPLGSCDYCGYYKLTTLRQTNFRQYCLLLSGTVTEGRHQAGEFAQAGRGVDVVHVVLLRVRAADVVHLARIQSRLRLWLMHAHGYSIASHDPACT